MRKYYLFIVLIIFCTIILTFGVVISGCKVNMFGISGFDCNDINENNGVNYMLWEDGITIEKFWFNKDCKIVSPMYIFHDNGMIKSIINTTDSIVIIYKYNRYGDCITKSSHNAHNSVFCTCDSVVFYDHIKKIVWTQTDTIYLPEDFAKSVHITDMELYISDSVTLFLGAEYDLNYVPMGSISK